MNAVTAIGARSAWQHCTSCGERAVDRIVAVRHSDLLIASSRAVELWASVAVDFRGHRRSHAASIPRPTQPRARLRTEALDAAVMAEGTSIFYTSNAVVPKLTYELLGARSRIVAVLGLGCAERSYRVPSPSHRSRSSAMRGAIHGIIAARHLCGGSTGQRTVVARLARSSFAEFEIFGRSVDEDCIGFAQW